MVDHLQGMSEEVHAVRPLHPCVCGGGGKVVWGRCGRLSDGSPLLGANELRARDVRGSPWRFLLFFLSCGCRVTLLILVLLQWHEARCVSYTGMRR